jgi:hypothetical protein
MQGSGIFINKCYGAMLDRLGLNDCQVLELSLPLMGRCRLEESGREGHGIGLLVMDGATKGRIESK